MRISDWSSDVCSSDLSVGSRRLISLYLISNVLCSGGGSDDTRFERHFGGLFIDPVTGQQVVDGLAVAPGDDAGEAVSQVAGGVDRSEEHTSELQSLMRISYAGFCLKKKNTNTVLV